MTENDTADFEFDSWEFFRSATVGNVRDRLWAGCDPNARDKNGFTPLYRAVAGKSDEPRVVELLFGAGAGLTASDCIGDIGESVSLFRSTPGRG